VMDSYDDHGKSPKCEHVQDRWTAALPSFCADGVTDPSTGDLIPDVAAGVAGATH